MCNRFHDPLSATDDGARDGRGREDRPERPPRSPATSLQTTGRLLAVLLSGLAATAMPGGDGTDHDASPLLADLSMLPPVWITASAAEVLLDDTRLLVKALEHQNVTVDCETVAELFHMWMLWPDLLAEARQSLDQAAAFLSRMERTPALSVV